MTAKPQNPNEDALFVPYAFPIHAFPADAQRYARELSAALAIPVDYAGNAMLAVGSAAIGSTRVIRPRRDHTEPALLYVANVANPGQKKTPLLQRVTRPVWEAETEAYETWKRARDAAQDGTRVPGQQHFAASNVTVEALPEMLTDHPRGFLYVQDELSGWVRSMDAYKQGGRGSDLQAWLSVWSCVPLTVKRVRRDPVHVPRPFVTVLGGIQPEMLGELATGPNGTIRADGFLDRLLFAFPDAPGFQVSWDEVSAEAEGRWSNIVCGLYALEHAEDGTPIPLNLEPDAREEYHAWVARTMAKAATGDIPEMLSGRYGKSESYALRLSLVLQLVGYATAGWRRDRISLDAICGGTALADYYMAHAHRVYTRISGGGIESAALRLLDWMKRGDRREVTPREVQSAQVANMRKVDHVHAVFDFAAQMGWGERVEIRHQSGPPVLGFRRFR